MSLLDVDNLTPADAMGPACTKCAGRTRLTGIEPHPTEAHTDLRTYQCMACDAVQAKVVRLAN